ncbi:hypothetical protein B0A53_03988 [Rhodotorula sp. CCFEE 5036]|nr:hypothetical protein B0A53_03988 [Rhodotorula sp. CCFEE 5036]
MHKRTLGLALSLGGHRLRAEEAPALLAAEQARDEQSAQQARDAVLKGWWSLGLTSGRPPPPAQPSNAVPAVSPATINSSSASNAPATHTTANVEQTAGSRSNQSERSPREQQPVSKDDLPIILVCVWDSSPPPWITDNFYGHLASLRRDFVDVLAARDFGFVNGQYRVRYAIQVDSAKVAHDNLTAHAAIPPSYRFSHSVPKYAPIAEAVISVGTRGIGYNLHSALSTLFPLFDPDTTIGASRNGGATGSYKTSIRELRCAMKKTLKRFNLYDPESGEEAAAVNNAKQALQNGVKEAMRDQEDVAEFWSLDALAGYLGRQTIGSGKRLTNAGGQARRNPQALLPAPKPKAPASFSSNARSSATSHLPTMRKVTSSDPLADLLQRAQDPPKHMMTSRPTPAAQPSTSSSSKGKGKKKEVANAAGGSGATMSTSGTSGAKNEEVKRTEKMACPECKKELNKKNMSRHLKDVHGLQNIAGPYKCKRCGDYFATAGVLDEHREWHRVPVSERSPTRTCEMCKLVYPSSKARKTHYILKHGPDAEQQMASRAEYQRQRYQNAKAASNTAGAESDEAEEPPTKKRRKKRIIVSDESDSE